MLTGTVVYGDGIGKTQGWPTANIATKPGEAPLACGVYAARATLFEKVYGAALVVTGHPYKIEVYLFDYVGSDFYGEQISVKPIKKVSDVVVFDTLQELQEKIDNDIGLVQKILEMKI